MAKTQETGQFNSGTKADLLLIDASKLQIGVWYFVEDEDENGALYVTRLLSGVVTFSKVESLPAPGLQIFMSPTGSDLNNGLTPATPLQSLAAALAKFKDGWSQEQGQQPEIVAATGTYPTEIDGFVATLPALSAIPLRIRSDYVSLAVPISGTADAGTNSTTLVDAALPGGLVGATIRWVKASGQVIYRKIASSAGGTAGFQRQIGGAAPGDTYEIVEPGAKFNISLGTIQCESAPPRSPDIYNLVMYGCSITLQPSALLGGSALLILNSVNLGCFGADFDLNGLDADPLFGGIAVFAGSGLLCTPGVAAWLSDLDGGSSFVGGSLVKSASSDLVGSVVAETSTIAGYWVNVNTGAFVARNVSFMDLISPIGLDVGGYYWFTSTGNFRGDVVGASITNTGPSTVTARNGVWVGGGSEIGMAADVQISLDATDGDEVVCEVDGRIDATSLNTLSGTGGTFGLRVVPGAVFTAQQVALPYTISGSVPGNEISYGLSPAPTVSTWAALAAAGYLASADGALVTSSTQTIQI